MSLSVYTRLAWVHIPFVTRKHGIAVTLITVGMVITRMDVKNNKMAGKKINKLCDEIECVLRVMARANNSGDDTEKEIEAGITLLVPLVNEIKGTIKTA